MADLVLISQHEKGFWQADLYLNGTHVRLGNRNLPGSRPTFSSQWRSLRRVWIRCIRRWRNGRLLIWPSRVTTTMTMISRVCAASYEL